MASPFKNKNVDESVNPKDIKNLIEQSNYTNRFLQCLGDNLSSSKSSSLSLQNVSEASTSKPIEKPLLKPFKMSSKAKQTLKNSILKQDTSESEVMQKIDLLLNRLSTVPETPINSGESVSRVQTRGSKLGDPKPSIPSIKIPVRPPTQNKVRVLTTKTSVLTNLL
ncbi:hypothetical protein PIB30_073627 [Stylosanthes scabra]|uniref:Uncharacterized protein n=1 Tax=Stylosanthes scabra TaxID=79078 RepID=A0ABU6WMS1_9FABA|nr:hypothetical protein [Stylosanthes scabra]